MHARLQLQVKPNSAKCKSTNLIFLCRGGDSIAKPGSIAGLVEKPVADKSPSNLSNISRYCLTLGIFDNLLIQHARAGDKIELSVVMNVQASNNRIEAVNLNGLRFDCDIVDAYLGAIMHLAQSRAF